MNTTYESHGITEAKISYWNDFPATEQNWFKDRVLAHETYTGKELEAMAINEAWRRSPQAKAEREAKDQEIANRLWTCKRTGKQYPANQCLISGNTAIGLENLTDFEKEMLDI